MMNGRYKFESICRLDGDHTIHGYEILSSTPHGTWLDHDLETVRGIAVIAKGLPGNISINLTTESIITMPEILLANAALVVPGLIIEWVESRSSDENVNRAAAILGRWREEHKIRVALDDMGKGQDCFERFLKVKPDFAKLDGTLLHGARTSTSYRNALRVLCNWCMAENVPTIIEWIETAEDLEIAMTCGAVFGQGYYFNSIDCERKRTVRNYP